MSHEQILHAIKSTVRSFLPESKVLLFGSRATGAAGTESDYDLLIIIPDEKFAPRAKMNLENQIRRTLIKSLNVPFDVILESEHEADKKKNLTGHIVYYAMKEAIEI